ncbi:hypothetical protein [Fundidesulfovibrio magnetotacticus]|uniref:hypothetical protein n=1 Tax=Fundidesulfovibrio magnetotacticus TaxID=2730080 RepID=UPI001F45A19A|nr:hypothetical protein [Fundidesulfovibrio magnetotacticus]
MQIDEDLPGNLVGEDDGEHLGILILDELNEIVAEFSVDLALYKKDDPVALACKLPQFFVQLLLIDHVEHAIILDVQMPEQRAAEVFVEMRIMRENQKHAALLPDKFPDILVVDFNVHSKYHLGCGLKLPCNSGNFADAFS